MSGALWFCFHIDLWKHKNCVIKVRLILITENHASRKVSSCFFKNYWKGKSVVKLISEESLRVTI